MLCAPRPGRWWTSSGGVGGCTGGGTLARAGAVGSDRAQRHAFPQAACGDDDLGGCPDAGEGGEHGTPRQHEVDAIWPNAPEVLTSHFALTDLTDDEIDKMTHRNAIEFFDYDPFSVRTREQCTVGALRAEAVGHDVSVQSKGRRHEHVGPVSISELTPTA